MKIVFFFKTLHDENSKCTGCLSQLDLPLELQNTQGTKKLFFSNFFMMKHSKHKNIFNVKKFEEQAFLNTL